MAELRCENLAKSYGEPHRAHGRRSRRPGGDAHGDPRRLRKRQDDAASPDHRLHRAGRGDVSRRRNASSPTRAALTSPPDKRAIGYVAQEGALFPHLTVAENVAFGLPRSERKTQRTDRRGARPRRARPGLRRPPSARALRRRAAPGRARPGARAPPARRAPRRALLGARRRTASRDARSGPERALASEGRPRCSSPTTRPRRSRWGARSPCCGTAGWCRRPTPTSLYRDPGRPRGRTLRRGGSRRARAGPRGHGRLRPRRTADRRLGARGRRAGDDPARADPDRAQRPGGEPGVAATVVGHNYFGPDVIVYLRSRTRHARPSSREASTTRPRRRRARSTRRRRSRRRLSAPRRRTWGEPR